MDAHNEAWLKIINEYHEQKQHWRGEGENLLTFETFLVNNFEPPVRKDSEEAKHTRQIRKALDFAKNYGQENARPAVGMIGTPERTGKSHQALMIQLATMAMATETGHRVMIVGGKELAEPFRTESPLEQLSANIIKDANERPKLSDFEYKPNFTEINHPNPSMRGGKSRKQRNNPRR